MFGLHHTVSETGVTVVVRVADGQWHQWLVEVCFIHMESLKLSNICKILLDLMHFPFMRAYINKTVVNAIGEGSQNL